MTTKELVVEKGDLIDMSKMVKTSSVDIIMQSKEYTSKMDEIMRSLYIGKYVIVKHQDAENSREIIDRTGKISYIHPKNRYFNVRFDDTGVEESYYPSDVLKGTVRLYPEWRFEWRK